MNEFYDVFIVALGGFVVLFSVIIFRKRPYFEKRKYKNAKQLKFTKNLQYIQELLFQRRIFISRIGDTLELKPDVFWCELLRHVSGGGQGGYTKQIDTIYIKSDRFNCFRWISIDLVGATLCYMDERGTLLIPANIIAFLDKYNVSICSGDWGLLLMKNSGYFKGFEVEEILKDIEDVKYLTKKLKPNI